MGIKELFEKYGYSLSAAQERAFSIYSDFLIEENLKYNLTAITDPEEIAVKHFLDSAAGEKYLKKGARLLDIGSGAGFPAVPLAIMRDDISVTMLDSRGKKIQFLKKIIEKIELTNAEAVNIRAEDYAKAERETYDAVSARAVALLPVLIEYAMPFLKIGGRLIAYKSDEKEAECGKAALNALHARIIGCESYRLENNARALIVIEKTAKTPSLYPRRGGKAGKF